MYIYIWYSKSKTFFIIDVSTFVFLYILLYRKNCYFPKSAQWVELNN